MTFLVFVCERLMGKAYSGTCWRCPFCESNHGCFSVRPPKGDYPIKYKCFRCGEWGDEFDLIKHSHPDDDYRTNVKRWRRLLNEYEAAHPSDAAETVQISSRGTGPINEHTFAYIPDSPIASAEYHAAIESVLEQQNYQSSDSRTTAKTLRLLYRVLMVCVENRLHPLGLAEWVEFCAVHEEHKADHLDEVGVTTLDCDILTCKATFCMKARNEHKTPLGKLIAKRPERRIRNPKTL
jgi:hypothetical protein